MKIFQNIRSTAEYVPSIEVNIDTVYVRSNIEKIREYLEKLTNEEDSGMLALMVSMLMSEVDMLTARVTQLEEV